LQRFEVAMLVRDQLVPGPFTLPLSGEVDRAVTQQLEPRLLDIALSTPGPTVAFDCAELTFIDSSGIDMLVRVAEQCGKAVRLVNLASGSRRLFEILDLCARFGLEDVRR
jgi:anti-anti-sigma factor